MSRNRKVFSALAGLTICCAFAGTTLAQHGPSGNSADNTPGHFDYYLLALSWAPELCATHGNKASSSECDPKRHFGFVVHGMWPQNDDGSYPMNCAPAQPVAQATVQHMLDIIPARGLIQHEWAEHGTCSGLPSQEYFADIENAFGAMQIPPEYRAPAQTISASPSEMEQKFAAANHAPTGAFRVTCSRSELVEMQVCLTKDLHYRECGSGVRTCRVRQVSIRPVP